MLKYCSEKQTIRKKATLSYLSNKTFVKRSVIHFDSVLTVTALTNRIASKQTNNYKTKKTAATVMLKVE